ncbi:Bro-N domain-containing protein [Paenibacillus alvei]|uniref:BRO-N domain-containing protein n=1 Tax=Paenibacillus alvei TaxID=44250 RepID=UPI0018CF933B|nr:Bro-N domain-containing protein [Paenibacillus alvei]MCY9579681.1 Bro-N domain-containing protein [Paenibacillus alvei]MCY9586335.1 Bro-N domain-containing protein [Paenibacillus alvei]
MNIRVEKWNGYDIRFVEKEASDWWAVASDVAKALGYRDAYNLTRLVDSDEKDTHLMSTHGGEQDVSIISETGMYEAVFNSKRSEAKDFKRWVKQLIKTLRQSTGLEGFQIFRMLDKDHQREAMRNLSSSLRQPVRRDFIKANTIADKAVSSKFGHPKMLKKNQMTPDMLVARQPILEDTVSLMSMVDHFKLDLSVSKTIYEKHA